VISNFISLGRFDEAEQALNEMRKINPDQQVVHATAAFLGFIRGDQVAMDREYEWAKGKPEEADFTAMLGALAMYGGKLKESEKLAQRAVELFMQQNRPENASNVLLGLAGNMAVLGKCDAAKNYVKAGTTLFQGEMGISAGAMVHAACGDSDRAQAMIDTSRKAAPKNTILASIITPMLRAEIERNRGNIAEAVQLLESIRAYDFGEATGLTTTFLRGHLYLEQRRGNEAAQEFKNIVERRGIDHFSPFHALAHVGLARAAALNGDTAAARKSYQDFFALWKDADADLPVVAQARKEYEQLKS
jgi:ATP/maltotriose-dependent transcriptional regulator MalT